jgi:hypothetical protein
MRKGLQESSRNLTMKTALRLGLLALGLGALPASVHAYGCPLFPCAGRCCTIQLGPWYLYYPYEAHFQTSAPLGPFPNWQAGVPMSAPMSYAPPAEYAPPAGYAPPAQAPWTPPAPQPLQPSGYVRPAGFNYAQPPSYWYGR